MQRSSLEERLNPLSPWGAAWTVVWRVEEIEGEGREGPLGSRPIYFFTTLDPHVTFKTASRPGLWAQIISFISPLVSPAYNSGRLRFSFQAPPPKRSRPSPWSHWDPRVRWLSRSPGGRGRRWKDGNSPRSEVLAPDRGGSSFSPEFLLDKPHPEDGHGLSSPSDTGGPWRKHKMRPDQAGSPPPPPPVTELDHNPSFFTQLSGSLSKIKPLSDTCTHTHTHTHTLL